MRDCGETNCQLAKCPFGVNLGIKCPCDTSSYTDRRPDGPSCYSEGPGPKLGTCYTVSSAST